MPPTPKLLIVYGTRPEAIKLAPLILQAKSENRDTLVCFTGQHREMVESIHRLFGIRPDFDLNIMTQDQTLNDIVAKTISQLSKVIQKVKPDYVVIQGDTSTSAAAAMAAFNEKIPVAHIEAGLRSNDLQSPWPEEFNRRISALCAKWHFAPTEAAKNNLIREGLSTQSIVVTGNTGIDSLLSLKKRLFNDSQLRGPLEKKYQFLDPNKKLILSTLHRRENHGAAIENIMSALKELSAEKSVQVLLPLHMNPQVRKSAAKVFNFTETKDSFYQIGNVFLVDPIDYLDFVYLMSRSYFIITDSGGIQEEAPALGKAILVTRKTTERPEAITAGNAILVGADKESILKISKSLLEGGSQYQNMSQERYPFGDGHACDRILKTLSK